MIRKTRNTGKSSRRTAPNSQRKQSNRSPRPSPAIRWLLAGGFLLVVGGLGLLAWTRTPLGQAALLRLGAGKMYAAVQARIDGELAKVLAPYLSEGQLGGEDAVHNWPLEKVSPGAAVRCRTVTLPPGLSYWELQARISAAIAPVGGRILWGARLARPGRIGSTDQPDEASDLLRVDLGVEGHPTHTLVFTKRELPTPRIAWGVGARVSAWSLLQATSPAPTVVLVLDDWGYFENEITDQLLALEVPLTLSILPGLPYSRRFALEATDLAVPVEVEMDPGPGPRHVRGVSLRQERLIRGCTVEIDVGASAVTLLPQRRRQVLLHLPMEPEDPQWNPGPRAITVGMSEKRMAEIIDAALASLPNITGVNNHMGSLATADGATMDRVMKLLARRDLLFLDSLTSSRSVAAEAAARAGIPALRNRIFLDQREPSREQVRRNLAKLIEVAHSTGFAVGIGHPYAETLAVLQSEVPRLLAAGVRFVTLSELVALQRPPS